MKFGYALPKLDGPRIVIVRRCYIALAAFILFNIVGNLIADTMIYLFYEPAIARYGFVVASDPSGHPLAQPIWLKRGSGEIKDEDRIVAIDGVALSEDDTDLTAERRLAQGGPVLLLDTEDDAGRASRHRLERGTQGGSRILPGFDVSLYAFVWDEIIGEFLADLLPFAISLTLFLRKTSDSEAMLLAFAILMMSNVGSNGSWPHEIGIPAGWLFARCVTIMTFLGWNLMLVGICAFPNGRFETRWSRIAAPASFVYGLFVLYGMFHPSGHKLASHILDTCSFGACLMSLVLRYRTLAPGIERQQIKWALFGAMIMALAAVVTVVLDLPGVTDKLGSLQLVTGNLIIVKELAFPLGLLVSLLRFRLYDADDIITRSAGYGGLTVAVVAVFGAADQFAQSTSQQYLGNSIGSWSSGVGAAAAALTIAPLHNRIMHWTERRFRSKLVQLRDGLPLLLSDMRELATPQVLAQATLDHIEGGVHARCGAVVQGGAILALANIGEDDVRAWLTRMTSGTSRVREVERSDKLFPLRIALHGYHEAADGWLLLGPRPDGTLYPHEEREALSDAAEAIARSLAVAAKRRDRDDRQDKEIEALRRLMEGVQAELQSLIGRIGGDPAKTG